MEHLTEKMIDDEPASRLLDSWIAKSLMGWRQKHIRDSDGESVPVANEPEYLFPPNAHSIHDPEQVPHYSTTWEGAGMVIEWLTVRYGFLEMGNSDKGWWVNLPVKHTEERTDWKILGRGETLPLAISRAALKTVLLQSPPVAV